MYLTQAFRTEMNNMVVSHVSSPVYEENSNAYLGCVSLSMLGNHFRIREFNMILVSIL
jgi:hypothetical protein